MVSGLGKIWLLLKLFLAVKLCFIAIANASQPIINTLDPAVDLGAHVEFIEDPTRTLDADTIRSEKYGDGWQKNQAAIFKGLAPNTRYWIRATFDLDLANDDSAVLYIRMQPGLVGDLYLEISDDSGYLKTVSTGAIHPYSQRDINYTRFAIDIPQRSGKIHLFGYLDNHDLAATAKLPLELISKEGLQSEQWKLDAITLLFYGGMGALFLYNLCLFLALRKPLYGIYILFLPCAMLTCSIIDGTFVRWFWPHNLGFDWRITFINGSLGAMLFMAFVYTALKRVSFWPKFTTVYRALMLLGALCMLLSIPYIEIAKLSMVYCAIVWTTMMVVLVTAVRKRLPTSIFLLLSETVTLAGATGFMLMMLDILPTNEWTQWAAHIGVAGEALLLSLTLAALTRLAFRERSEAERTLLVAQKQIIEEHESSQKLKDSFMSTVTHELLTPLNGIRLSLSLLKPTVIDDGEEFLDMAQNSSGQHA